MKSRRTYDIAFVGLNPDVHVFEYAIDDTFFESYGKQDFEDSKIDVKLELQKRSGALIWLKFNIGGSVTAPCDRCGNPVDLELWDEFEIIVKMVDNPEEMNETEEDPDIYYIARTESHINVADWIYEFANLSIPSQRYCREDENGNSLCNPEVLKRLDQMEKDAEEQKKTDSNSNPIWKDLDQFKNLDN